MKRLSYSLLTAIFTLISAQSQAASLSGAETSYSGAKILEGDLDIFLYDSASITNEDEVTDTYAFFEGNTLYAGSSDQYGNTVDAIIEFFWFESSIDRGSDFYVAVIKSRVTPGDDCTWTPFGLGGAKCKLWTDQWQDFGEHPVLSVEALTDITKEQGAFRWDWSLPFENYGIDAYGQVTLKNEYGLGVETEGAAVAHGEYKLDEEGNVELEGEVQIKGYSDSDFKVKTQYNVTLWEWEVFVDGRADLMAWDMYLNLSARDEQSAYHEYFLSIQVEEGEMFTLDQINILGNFDVGWYNPFHKELGVSLGPIAINQPYYDLSSPEVEEIPDLNPDDPVKEKDVLESDYGDVPGKSEHSVQPPSTPEDEKFPVEEAVAEAIEENDKDPDPNAGYRDLDWINYDNGEIKDDVVPVVNEREILDNQTYSNGCNAHGGSNAPVSFLLLIAAALLFSFRRNNA